MKVKCRKQQAGVILNMKQVYNRYMYNRQIETDLQNFKTDGVRHSNPRVTVQIT